MQEGLTFPNSILAITSHICVTSFRCQTRMCQTPCQGCPYPGCTLQSACWSSSSVIKIYHLCFHCVAVALPRANIRPERILSSACDQPVGNYPELIHTLQKPHCNGFIEVFPFLTEIWKVASSFHFLQCQIFPCITLVSIQDCKEEVTTPVKPPQTYISNAGLHFLWQSV